MLAAICSLICFAARKASCAAARSAAICCGSTSTADCSSLPARASERAAATRDRFPVPLSLNLPGFKARSRMSRCSDVSLIWTSRSPRSNAASVGPVLRGASGFASGFRLGALNPLYGLMIRPPYCSLMLSSTSLR